MLFALLYTVFEAESLRFRAYLPNNANFIYDEFELRGITTACSALSFSLFLRGLRILRLFVPFLAYRRLIESCQTLLCYSSKESTFTHSDPKTNFYSC